MVKRINVNKDLSVGVEKSACCCIFPDRDVHKGILLSIIIFSTLFFLSLNATFSSNYLHLSGWVVQNEKSLNNSTITVYEGDSVIHTMRSNYLGSYSIFLPFQKEFRFVFSKSGLITKSVIIDTRTPEEPDPNYYYFFRFEVELFEDNPNARREFFNDPVAIVYYDVGIEEFRFHRNNVKVHSTKARSRRATEEQVWPFEDPESFFTYLQETVANPEQVNIIPDVPAVEKQTIPLVIEHEEPVETATKEKEEASAVEREVIYAEDLQLQENAQSVSKEKKHEPVPYPYDKAIEETVPAKITQVATDKEVEMKDDMELKDFFITFYDYRNESMEVDPGQEVFFSVQLLATVKHIPRGFFNRFLNNFPDAGMLHYHDHDEMDKYITGIYSSLEEAFEKHRQLRETGIEGYIVAFAGNRRISVKQALAILP